MLRRWMTQGLAAVAISLAAPVNAQVPAPETVLGFTPGTDRKLVEWPVLVDYYRTLGTASPRVEYRELGRTTLGAPFIALVISSSENMQRLDEIRVNNARLADPRLLESGADRARAIEEGKAIVLITSSIHSTEVGGHLSPTIIAHRLATEDTDEIRAILANTVVILVPSLNPDGITIVSRWYNETLGTPSEGVGPPELYHHYVGHDNNRDWYAFTQVETQLTIDSLYSVWHPQIVHDIHQQGPTGSRYFLPPFLDPIEPNVDPLLVQGYNTLGTFMAWELTGQGKTGIVVNATYDAWTPARAYMHHHAGVRVLSETASARLASPITLGWDDLSERGRNFSPKEASWNFVAPWRGGEWGLEHIVDYQSSGAIALAKHAALNREVWLSNFVQVGERAVKGWEDWPGAFVITRDQRNEIGLRTLLGILRRGQVEIHEAQAAFPVGGREFPAGTFVIPLRQPYASFAKALLERQDYPDRRQYPGGPPQAPYDVTAHTLPLLMDVEVVEMEDEPTAPLSGPIDPPEPVYRFNGLNDSNVRVGLYRSYRASMDEGWTRWIFDTWKIPYRSSTDSDIRRGGLADALDVLILPDMSTESIREGLPGHDYPEEYAGGIGASGAEAIREFVREGGTLVALNESTEFAIGLFGLAVENVTDGLREDEFYAPGTLFRIDLTPDHFLTAGMPDHIAAWFQRGPAFRVIDDTDLDVVARYPSDASEVLLSGWVLHPERIAGQAALIEARVGRGRVILFGFRPQYRGQSIATYPLFFNALSSR